MGKQVQVFVFGTLRVGSGQWAEAAEVADPIEGCTARGKMYSAGGFPYVDFSDKGEVKGDVLTFDEDHPMYLHMCDVELGAGYYAREIPVTLPSGETMICMAWDVRPRTLQRAKRSMPVVDDGDWVAEEARLSKQWRRSTVVADDEWVAEAKR